MTKAEQLLKAPRDQIRAVAIRAERTDTGALYTLPDRSQIEFRQMGHRAAFAANGWRLADA